MQFWRRLVLTLLCTLVLTACSPLVEVPLAWFIGGYSSASSSALSATPPSDCEVTLPSDPLFVPPADYMPEPAYGFWYGTDELWTELPLDGVWASLPQQPEGYFQKLPFWSDGFWWLDDPQPSLSVTGRRLDGDAAPAIMSMASGIYAENEGSLMLLGATFPTPGCWQITAEYKGSTLSYVIWIAP
ncbi:MAG: hypothetical protein KF726_01735 [Anaerolineae bacterium]|nr:hypothetical protein [Anaerolineae bacterium]